MKNDSTSYNFTCFECGKPSHIKFQCSIFLKKQQGGEKKARIACNKNTSSTSSDSRNEEEANSCLMVDGEVESTVSSSKSEAELDENYY